MILRRLPMLAISVAVAVAVVLVARSAVSPVGAVFSTVSTPWMPSLPSEGGLTSTWFCPGVPAAGDEGTGGTVTVFNTGDGELRGRLTVLRGEGDPVTQAVDVAPYGSQQFDLDELVDTPFAAAFVEIDGGGGFVEQRAVHPAAESVAACANASNDAWYLAAGDTLDDSVEQLVISNPHDSFAVVDVTLATERGPRIPERFQGFLIPAQSVRVIDVGVDVIGDQTRIGVSVVAQRGRVVVGRSQLLGTETRTGYVMTLAAPALNEQWWFVYGERADDVVERYYLYNPGETDVEVQPVVLGFQQEPDYEAPAPVTVPDGEIVEFSTADIAGLPDGRHNIVFSALEGQPFVVERVLTRTIQGIRTTSITLGARPRPDAFVATTWHAGYGALEPVADALTLYNIDGVEAQVTVEAITAEGPQPIPGLADVRVAGGGLVSLDLTDPLAVGNQLVVRSTQRIFVERVLPRESGSQGRVAVWAVPANP